MEKKIQISHIYLLITKFIIFFKERILNKITGLNHSITNRGIQSFKNRIP